MPSDERAFRFLSNVSPKLIYGGIMVAAVLGSMTDPLPGSLRVIVILFVSLYAMGLASTYSRAVVEDIAQQRRTTWIEWSRILLTPSWVMGSLAVPVFFFGLAALGLIDARTALTGTKLGLAALLFVFGGIASRLSGAGWGRSSLFGINVALLGYAVVEIKLWTKYLPANIQ